MCGCVYVLKMSRSHLHWSRCPTEEGGGCLMYRLPLCFLPLSFPLFSQICLCHSVFIVLHLICLILSQCLSLPPILSLQPSVFICQSLALSTYSFSISLAVFYYSVYCYLTNIHSESIIIVLSPHILTLVPSCLFHCQSGS